MIYRNTFVILFALISQVTFAQFIGNDTLPSNDEDFSDSDSAIVFYVRYNVGYTAISKQAEFNTVMRKTFEQKFGNSVILSNHRNAIASGLSLGISGFRKINRLFAIGGSIAMSPVIKFNALPSNETNENPSHASNEELVAQDAFVQAFHTEVVGECRFKMMLFDFGVGAQIQRLGDNVIRKTNTEQGLLQSTSIEERRAWTLSPMYFFSIGIDIFFGQSISLIPNYKSFYWHYGGIKGSGDLFQLSLRTNL